MGENDQDLSGEEREAIKQAAYRAVNGGRDPGAGLEGEAAEPVGTCRVCGGEVVQITVRGTPFYRCKKCGGSYWFRSGELTWKNQL